MKIDYHFHKLCYFEDQNMVKDSHLVGVKIRKNKA